MKLHTQILIAMVLGAVVGYALLSEGFVPSVVGAPLLATCNFLGDLFLRALGMLVVPLIVSSVISGIGGVGDRGTLGRLGRRTLLFYVGTTLAAILTGLFLVNLIEPGLVGGEPARALLGLSEDASRAAKGLAGATERGLDEIILGLIPKNPVGAAARGDILPLVLFSILFAIFATRLSGTRRQTFVDVWQGIFDVMMYITSFVMKIAPLGVFGLIARTVATAGLDGAAPLLWYALTVASGLGFHALVTLPLLLFFLARVNPVLHARTMADALLTAFSTSSSSATLPVTMNRVEYGAGVSNRVTSFVLPLGATVNMDGTALYECAAALFIAQAYGVELSAFSQALVVVTALLASIGAAGIPSAGLVMVAVILGAVGLPLEGVGLILAVDRILDMCRTTVNVWSDSTCALVVARLEGEEPYAAPEASATPAP